MKYSVVIPTHNKCEEIQICLKQIIAEQVSGDFEIIVVADGCRDNTVEVLKNFDPQGIPFRFFVLPGCGPATARNTGIAAAKGEIICLFDDDAYPCKGWLAALTAPFAGSPDVVGVEGAVIPCKNEFGLLGMSPSNFEGGVYLTCNIAFRRDVLEKIGAFDQGFAFAAFEDTDLAMEVLKYGKILFVPDARAEHPCRCWSLKRAIWEINFYKSLLRFTLRHGCLGWPDSPTRWPRLRIYWSAVVALPLGRALKGLKSLGKPGSRAGRYIAISLTQGCIAAVKLPLWLLRSRKQDLRRIPMEPHK